MRKRINPQAIEIQNRFFAALNLLIDSGQISGIKGFCEANHLNRIKYSNIRSEMNKPESERKATNYRIIDIDALTYLCMDYNVSAEWLLLGKGKMLV